MILRVLFNTGYQVNYDLGNEWHWVGREEAKEDFEKARLAYFGENEKMGVDCFGIIHYGKGMKEAMPLYSDHSHWILSTDGQVFEQKNFR